MISDAKLLVNVETVASVSNNNVNQKRRYRGQVVRAPWDDFDTRSNGLKFERAGNFSTLSTMRMQANLVTFNGPEEAEAVGEGAGAVCVRVPTSAEASEFAWMCNADRMALVRFTTQCRPDEVELASAFVLGVQETYQAYQIPATPTVRTGLGK